MFPDKSSHSDDDYDYLIKLLALGKKFCFNESTLCRCVLFKAAYSVVSYYEIKLWQISNLFGFITIFLIIEIL